MDAALCQANETVVLFNTHTTHKYTYLERPLVKLTSDYSKKSSRNLTLLPGVHGKILVFGHGHGY